MRNQGAALKSPKGLSIWLVAAMVLAVIFLPAGAVGAQTELGSISGTVYDNASPPNPLEGAFVYTYPAGGGPWMGTAVTGTDGRYVIPTLPSGDYEVHASLNGWADLSPSPPVTVTAPYETTGVDRYLVPTPASINGRVVSSSGDPVGGVSVNADDGSGFGCSTVTDPDGYFNIEGLPYGTYRVSSPAQGVWGPLEEQVWVCQVISGVVLSEAEPVASGLLITLQPAGFILGAVTGSDGQPLSGIYIWADIEPWGSFSFGRTDANGQYVLGGLPSGDYRIRAAGNPGYADEYYLDSYCRSGSTLVPVTAGSETSDIDFTLDPGGTISGRIVDLDGNPVYGVGVAVCADDGSSFGCCSVTDPDGCFRTAVTDADGYFNIEGLPYGTYRVNSPAYGVPGALEKQVWVYQEIFGVVLSETEPVAGGLLITLQPAGFILGTVTGPDGQPLVGILPHIEPWGPGCYCFGQGTDANGQYVLGGLPSGNYRVSAMSNPGYADEYYLDSHNWIGSTIVPVTAGSETRDIDFTLEPGGTISGRIVDLDGNPVYGVSVLLENPDIIRRGFVTRASEAYSFSGLPYGTYTMTCPSGFWLPADLDWQQQVVTVVLGPDTPDVVYNFLLAPPVVVVSGTVKFTPTVLNLNSNADLCARIELEPGYSAADIDLTTIRLESDLGVVAAERAEVRRGLLWVWFDCDTIAPILSVSDDLTLTVKGSIGSADLEAVGHLRVVAPRKSK